MVKYSMDSASSQQVANPQRLKNLACNVKFSEGNTLLHHFVLYNSDPNDSASVNYINDVLRAMSDVPASIINALNNDGYSALDLAVLKRNLLMVKMLLSCLINVDVNRNRLLNDSTAFHQTRLLNDNTALHLAVKLGHLSILQELLGKGSRIGMESEMSRTALHLAVLLCDLDAVKFLVNKGTNVKSGNVNDLIPPPLYHAAISGNLAIVEFLIDGGADLNGADIEGYGWWSLRYLAQTGKLDIFKIFLDRSVNFDIKSERGCELLICAVEFQNLDSIQFLVSYGADVNGKTEGIYITTPLLSAVLCENLEIIEWLVSNGADINAKDGNGRTPLNLYIRRRVISRTMDLEIVAFLIDHGADLNSRDDFGMTPLHYAAKEGHVGVMRAILDRGADVNVKNKRGQTPLDTARESGQISCIDVLINFR